MSYFVTADATGVIATRLVGGVHVIPEHATKVSAEDWYRLTQEADGVWHLDADGKLTKKPYPEVAPDIPRMIADKRYEAEVSGITFNELNIDSGRDSQGLITGAALQAIIDPQYTLRWKTQSGFVELTGSQIIEVATAIRSHVQACFDREAELLAAVEGGTFTQDMLDAGWPT